MHPQASGTRRRLPGLRSRRWAAGGGILLALLLTGCQIPAFGAYRGVTTQGNDSFKLWQAFFIAGCVVVGLVFLLIIWAVLRYRHKSDTIPLQTQYHTVLEITYTVIPIILVLVLFLFTVITENEVDALSSGGNTVTVNVTAFQWGWEFQYPNYDVKVLGIEKQDPEMVLPTHETVRIFLRSADVIHGFYVPQFNFNRYALPGVTNQFDFNVQHAGTYRGQCNQFCGLYHSEMFFQVKAIAPAQFKTWLHREQTTPSTSGSIAQAKREILQGRGS